MLICEDRRGKNKKLFMQANEWMPEEESKRSIKADQSMGFATALLGLGSVSAGFP
jgi:hypothetical protein